MKFSTHYGFFVKRKNLKIYFFIYIPLWLVQVSNRTLLDFSYTLCTEIV